MISSTTPDWSREQIRSFWDPGRKLLRSIRRYQRAKQKGGVLNLVLSKHWVLVHRFWSVITGCEIPLNTRIGGGLLIPHPTGIVIHADAVIGPNCLIFHQVTLAGVVQMGGHVDIGAGAKILGPVWLGDHTRVGANAVVTRDVEAGTTVVGAPARTIDTPAMRLSA